MIVENENYHLFYQFKKREIKAKAVNHLGDAVFKKYEPEIEDILFDKNIISVDKYQNIS
jgi:hypothetical protein